VPRLEPVAGRPVSLPPRPEAVAGREDLLAVLSDRLAGGDRPWPRVVALHGMGGSGKTTLAAEYAHRHLDEVGLAWQFPAEDPTVLQAEFGRLAALLGAAGGLADPRDPVAAVHAVLADRPRGWLLIFDNAPGPAAVRDFLPAAGRGQVLITSRHGLWPAGQGLDVPVLDRAVAAAFLSNRTDDPDQDAASALAGELGGLPLALAHAAAYMAATGTSLARYLELFRRRRSEVLARRVDDPAHPAGVAATLGVALSELEAGAPAAAGLLRLLACLAPEPVPVSMFLHNSQNALSADSVVDDVLVPLLGDELAIGDAVTALRRYSLVTPAGGGMVVTHRLVQAVTVDQMAADLAAGWRRAAAGLVEAAIPADTGERQAWEECAVLLPHARAVLDLTSYGMWQMALALGNSGSYPAARDLFAQIAQARENAGDHGPEHSDTLAARNALAVFTGHAGDAAGARDLLAALLPARELVLGADHPDILTTRHQLATFTGHAGDAAGARDLLAALLPDTERVLGPEHPHTLAARHQLATYTGDTGNAAGARDLLAALLPDTERVLGPEHPSTLTTRHQLATYTGHAGDPAAARDLLAALLPVKERVFGPEHPSTLSTRHQLASYTGQAGDPAAARDLLAALLPVRERVSGPEHPSTLTTRHQLANCTGDMGDPAAARALFAALLPDTERILGPEHPETLAVRHQLAAYTGEAGDPAGAGDLYAALLPVKERVLGPEHPSTLTTRRQLAYWRRRAD
jgi:predicted component of type VI protein secretion system